MPRDNEDSEFRRLGARAPWLVVMCLVAAVHGQTRIGEEKAVTRHLRNGEEFQLPAPELVDAGRRLFTANWTAQDGGGRPLSKGTGQPLSERSTPLTGPRAFNRVSGPDANSCQGCHIGPYQLPGGGGDFVANVWVGSERFDYLTFARDDVKPSRGAIDERGPPVTLQSAGNSRLTPGLWGAGYLEMLARQMSADLRRIRDALQPGQSRPLIAKGISFGALARRRDGSWDVSQVTGLPAPSLQINAPSGAPSLLIRPWRQSGSVVSLRDLTNTSFNQHHGIQSTERFGLGTDPDGDGVVNELTRADVTAATTYEATLAVPGRVIPNDPAMERAILAGERRFAELGCTACHVASLPLERGGWMFTEPGPYNPPKNLRAGEAPTLSIDLSSQSLPLPRLGPAMGNPAVVAVPAYTDFKLHDVTDGQDADAAEALDVNESPGSPRFFAGNRKFLTRRLWDVGNQPAHFHHGLFSSLKQAVVAHAGEALDQRQAFQRLTALEQDAVLIFVKSLQVLPPGTQSRIVDEHFKPKAWPPR